MTCSDASRLLDRRYRLVRRLAEGGMGVIWEAVHIRLDLPVAIKLLHPRLEAEDTFVRKFRWEARVLALLRSRHVVEVLDFGVHEGSPFLVMELLQGHTLSERCFRGGALPLDSCQLIACQIAEALALAHARRIVHCDLKPDNVFLAREGDGLVAKLLDFGVAHLGCEATSSDAIEGALVGTPAYMSPEMLEGRAPRVPQTDVWSFGALIYECLLGYPAFPALTLADRIVRLNPPCVPRAGQAALPRGFEAWFRTACARSPADRFSSIVECAEAFAALRPRGCAGVRAWLGQRGPVGHAAAKLEGGSKRWILGGDDAGLALAARA